MTGTVSSDLQRVGRNVKAARALAGLTQDGLAVAVSEAGHSMDRGYVSRLESGKHNPSTETLIRIARALGTTPARLLDGLE